MIASVLSNTVLCGGKYGVLDSDHFSAKSRPFRTQPKRLDFGAIGSLLAAFDIDSISVGIWGPYIIPISSFTALVLISFVAVAVAVVVVVIVRCDYYDHYDH